MDSGCCVTDRGACRPGRNRADGARSQPLTRRVVRPPPLQSSCVEPSRSPLSLPVAPIAAEHRELRKPNPWRSDRPFSPSRRPCRRGRCPCSRSYSSREHPQPVRTGTIRLTTDRRSRGAQDELESNAVSNRRCWHKRIEKSRPAGPTLSTLASRDSAAHTAPTQCHFIADRDAARPLLFGSICTESRHAATVTTAGISWPCILEVDSWVLCRAPTQPRGRRCRSGRPQPRSRRSTAPRACRRRDRSFVNESAGADVSTSALAHSEARVARRRARSQWSFGWRPSRRVLWRPRRQALRVSAAAPLALGRVCFDLKSSHAGR